MIIPDEKRKYNLKADGKDLTLYIDTVSEDRTIYNNVEMNLSLKDNKQVLFQYQRKQLYCGSFIHVLEKTTEDFHRQSKTPEEFIILNALKQILIIEKAKSTQKKPSIINHFFNNLSQMKVSERD